MTARTELLPVPVATRPLVLKVELVAAPSFPRLESQRREEIAAMLLVVPVATRSTTRTVEVSVELARWVKTARKVLDSL